MNRYDKFINDPYFLKWIFQTDSLTEQYWDNYIKEHSDEKALILAVKKELDYLKLKNKDLSNQEKKVLLHNILKQKNQATRNTKYRKFRINILKYAAIAIIFLAIGNIIMYLYMRSNQQQLDYTSMDYNVPVDKPTIFLSDGSNIELEKNSTIKYDTDQNIIVDDKPINSPSVNIDEVVINHTVIPGGNRSKITLSDNTVVHMNAGSKLIYPSAFKGSTREVLLFGEAFFEVTKDEEKPFVVKTSTVTLEVLGTKFNLSAYTEDNIVQAVLVEGEVAVKRNDAPFYERSIIMKPNQMVTYNKKTKNLSTMNVDTEYYTLWKDGVLKFEDEDFNRIIKRLERFYNITINFEDPLKGGVKISGKLDFSKNKDEVFEYLSILTKMEFRQIGENYYKIN